MSLAPLLIALLAGGGGARAESARVEDLRWAWPAEDTRRVHILSTVAMPQLLRLELPGGTGLRVTVVEVEYVARCSLVAEQPSSWELECPLEAVRMAAQPIREEMDRADVLQGILDNFTWRLKDAWLQVEVGKDGKLRHFDLQDRVETMLGDRKETELMRRLMRQGFAGLELQLPLRGAAGKEWQTQNPRLAEHLAYDGTHGITQLSHRIRDVDGPRVFIESTGKGAMQPAPGRLMGLEMVTEQVFDQTAGMVEEARWAGIARPTASHIFAWTDETRPYLFWGQARIAPLDAPVLLGSSGPMDFVPLPEDLQERLSGGSQAGLSPPGRETEPTTENFGYFRLGVGAGLGGGVDGRLDAEGEAGIRFKSDVWAGLGARVGLPVGRPIDTEAPPVGADVDGLVKVNWSPETRVSPRLGFNLGAGYRSWGGDLPGFEVVPLLGPEIGGRARIGAGIWLDVWARSTLAFGRIAPFSQAEWGGSEADLTHRAGVSLLFGPTLR